VERYRPTTDKEKVERALLKRALGFEYTEVRTDVENGRITKTKKYAEPDVRAALTWLYNRDPERWKLRPEPDGAGLMADILVKINAANMEAARQVLANQETPPAPQNLIQGPWEDAGDDDPAS
jgi:hypothetical protein